MKYYCLYKSPVGLLQLVSDGSALVGLTFIDDENSASLTEHTEQREVYPFQQTVKELDNIFRGICRTLIFRFFCTERNFKFAYGTNFGISHLAKPFPTKPRRKKWGMLRELLV